MSIKILILFLIYLNPYEFSLMSKFQRKNDYNTKKFYNTSTSFASLNLLTSAENLPNLQCISLCYSYANCFSTIYSKYNSTFSLCSLLNNYPSIGTDLVLSQNQYIQQKIFLRKSIKFFFHKK